MMAKINNQEYDYSTGMNKCNYNSNGVCSIILCKCNSKGSSELPSCPYFEEKDGNEL
jgi:hypothetical protein